MAGEKEIKSIQGIKVLHLEDNPSDAALINYIIKSAGLKPQITHVRDGIQFRNALGDSRYDLVLCDYTIPSYDGLEALSECRKHDRDVPFIFISGTIGEERAVESLKQGATDYILKSHPERLTVAIRRALEESAQKKEHQRVEEALRKSEKRLRHIAENAKDAIYSFQYVPEPRFDYMSPAVILVTGDSPEDFYRDATLVLQRVVPEDQKIVREILEQRKIPEGPVQLRWMHRNGSVIWTEHTISPVHENGELTGFEGIGRDITQAKESEIKIREQAELLDKATDTIFLVNLEGKLCYSNFSAQRLLGFAQEELEALPLKAIWGEEGRSVQDQLDQVYAEKEWSGELHFKSKEGSALLFHSRWSLIKRAGAEDAMLVINSDITEKKRLEMQLFRAQRLECVGSLAGGIAHDLNNVLAPILMASSMMRTEEDKTNILKWSETIESSAMRGAELIKQILAFARGSDADAANIDLVRVIKDVQKVLRATLPANIKVVVKAMPKLWQVKGNFTELHQVVMNLCINARDAMPAGGTITLRAENKNPLPFKKLVQLEVEDTGTGMPPDVVARIFEPFFTTKPLGQGTGLGLATVQAIIQKYQGTLEVQSEVGKGTLFRIVFPAVEDAREQRSVAAEELAPGHGENLLLVEDEAALREMLRTTLGEFGYKVTTATNGIEAMQVLEETQEPFDLVVTDISMPMMGGTALASELIKRNPQQKILVMSGMLERQAFDAIEAEKKFLVSKPFSTGLFLRELRKALESP